MLGAIAGDIIGSVYEFHPIKSMDFPLFDKRSTWTDDSVLTLAVAETLLTGRPYKETIREFALANSDAGFGGMFVRWFTTQGSQPYNSFGNGSAMRVSPVGWAFDTLEETLAEAKCSAEVTHNHPEGIKGAQSVAAAIFLARQGTSQTVIRRVLETRFGYDLHRTYEDMQPSSSFDETCQRSVPEALICALTSMSFEGAVCQAVVLGGDADTQAAIAGSVAEALYGGVPESIAKEAPAWPRSSSISSTPSRTSTTSQFCRISTEIRVLNWRSMHDFYWPIPDSAAGALARSDRKCTIEKEYW